MLRNKLLEAAGLLLSLLIISPQFVSIPLTASMLSQPRIVSVGLKSSSGLLIGKMGNYSVAIPVDRYTIIETWTNGTKGYFSIHIHNTDPQRPYLWVNCTAWLPENKTVSRTSSLSASSLQPLSEGNLPKEWLDNLKFIYGSNSTCWTTYKHDDNYETYYPFEWNNPYALQGQTRNHIHLTQELLDKWYWDELQTATVMGLCMVGYEYVIDQAGIDFLDLPIGIVEFLVIAAVSEAFGEPAATVVMVLIALAEILEAIWEHITKAYWLDTVVKEHFGGDGWAWRGPIDIEFWCKIWDPYYWKPMTVCNWHRIGFYNQTWGTDGVFGVPQAYAFDFGFHHQTCSPKFPSGGGVSWR